MYGQWRRPNIEPTAFGQAMQQSELYDPTTAAVARTYAQEATVGVGTLKADLAAADVTKAEESGVKISEDEYKNNPELFSEGISWHDGMTKESALVTKEFNDAARKRSQILSDASTSQSVLGFGVGFAAGVVEPKNLATGIALSVATEGLGSIGWLGGTMKRAYQMKKTASLAQKVAIGATEGVVAGAAIEPSNRYSAKILQQDYTMMDSLFNVATSAAFGGLMPVAGKGIKDAAPFMREKIDKFKGRTMDVVTAEMDLATSQFASGQRVDVGVVEAGETKIDLRTAENIKSLMTVEPKANAAADAVDGKWLMTGVMPTGKPGVSIEVGKQRGTGAGSRGFDDKLGAMRELTEEENPSVPLDKSQSSGHQYVVSRDENGKVNGVLSVFVDENGKAIEDGLTVFVPEEARGKGIASSLYKKADEAGLDVSAVSGRGSVTKAGAGFAAGRTKKEYEALGITGEMTAQEIAAKLESARGQTLAKAQADALDPTNDTLIDYSAIDAADERRAIMGVENEADAEAYFQDAEAEIKQMLADDMLNEADLAEYRQALEELQSREPVNALETLKLCLTRG